jgi:hypothetical protein
MSLTMLAACAGKSHNTVCITHSAVLSYKTGTCTVLKGYAVYKPP